MSLFSNGESYFIQTSQCYYIPDHPWVFLNPISKASENLWLLPVIHCSNGTSLEHVVMIFAYDSTRNTDLFMLPY